MHLRPAFRGNASTSRAPSSRAVAVKMGHRAEPAAFEIRFVDRLMCGEGVEARTFPQ